MKNASNQINPNTMAKKNLIFKKFNLSRKCITIRTKPYYLIYES